MIKERKGFERLMILITRRRKYNCCDCDLTFRLGDRRVLERAESEAPMSNDVLAIPRPEQHGGQQRLDSVADELPLRLAALESRLTELQKFCMASKDACGCEPSASQVGTVDSSIREQPNA
jgi:hypothetical protein